MITLIPNNLYHVYHKMPALEKQDMYIELEEIAESLIDSGLLRIDADTSQNFTRFSLPTRNVNINFSKRELYEERHHHRIYRAIGKALKESAYSGDIDKKIASEIDNLKNQLNKFVDIEPYVEMQIARILIQSAHPVVFLMLILEQVEIFVSYGQNIGDVMDIDSWRTSGTNSGMQSTDGRKTTVFVSCGGDPLLLDPTEEQKQADRRPEEDKTYGDGLPALARMMGVAGQETGHYSDIVHNENGQQIGRYSANFSATRANPKVNLARLTDLKNINTYWQLLHNIGIESLIEREDKIKFYRRNPYKSIGYFFHWLIFKIHSFIFIIRAKKINFAPISEIKSEYIGFAIQELSADMAFNLAPKADVYSSSDRLEEEAIACVEALARVPQQANKWGHINTRFFWRNLYKFYYDTVIPNDIAIYETMSGKKFTAYPKNFHRYSFFEKLKMKFKKRK